MNFGYCEIFVLTKDKPYLAYLVNLMFGWSFPSRGRIQTLNKRKYTNFIESIFLRVILMEF